MQSYEPQPKEQTTPNLPTHEQTHPNLKYDPLCREPQNETSKSIPRTEGHTRSTPTYPKSPTAIKPKPQLKRLYYINPPPELNPQVLTHKHKNTPPKPVKNPKPPQALAPTNRPQNLHIIKINTRLTMHPQNPGSKTPTNPKHPKTRAQQQTHTPQSSVPHNNHKTQSQSKTKPQKENKSQHPYQN